MAKRRSGCARTIVKFKTRRGKTISFPGHQGSACAPRKKPSTRHLRPYKEVMAKAAPQCARRHGGGTRAFAKCVGQAVRSVRG
jgi:hypothetical protein